MGRPAIPEQDMGGAAVLRAATNGVMWLNMGGGISRYDGTTFPRFTPTNGLTVTDASSVRGLQPMPDGSLIAATMHGATRFDGNKFVPWPTNLSRLNSLRCYTVIRDGDGLVWLGTPEGVFLTDGTAWSN